VSEALVATSEGVRLAELEATIERGLQTFVDVGNALLEIRDGRLYRAQYGTFELYCRERWGFSNENARRLMRSAEVMQVLEAETPPIGGVLPTTESQARPLTALPPDAQREAWQRAVETAPDGKMTAAHVQRVVDEQQSGGMAHVGHNSGDNEWYTPADYIDAACAVMGGIDLDPASSETANQVVGAATFYTARDDGLLHEWRGNVWMNPPYAQPLIQQFCDKLVAEVRAGNVTEAIVLVNNATETRWFQGIATYASAICFPLGRVRFWAPDKISAPLQGQAVLYIGLNTDDFRNNFEPFGMVFAR